MAVRLGAEIDVGNDGLSQGRGLHCEELHLEVHGGVVFHIHASDFCVFGCSRLSLYAKSCRACTLDLMRFQRGFLLWMVAKSISHHLRSPGFG